MYLPRLKNQIAKLDNDSIWDLYAYLNYLLKENGLVRTKNIVGERGEFLAIEIYNKTPNLPNLQAAPEGTKNVDALSRMGDRYSIKTISYPNKTTGVFHGYGSPDEPIDKQLFEYLIIVIIDNYLPRLIVELTWNQFYKYKKWHSVMRAYNISLTKLLIDEAKIIYEYKQKSK